MSKYEEIVAKLDNVTVDDDCGIIKDLNDWAEWPIDDTGIVELWDTPASEIFENLKANSVSNNLFPIAERAEFRRDCLVFIEREGGLEEFLEPTEPTEEDTFEWTDKERDDVMDVLHNRKKYADVSDDAQIILHMIQMSMNVSKDD